MGQIITVLSKSPMFSKTPELKHMVLRTNDLSAAAGKSDTAFL